MRQAFRWLTVALTVTSALFAANVAPAQFDVEGGGPGTFATYPYTLKGCPAAYQYEVDPVNVVFYGQATADRALNHVRSHLGWTNEAGSTQYFSSHGSCGPMYGQKASACGTCTRYHVRARRTAQDDGYWGITATAAAHHEDWVWSCGHAVDKGGTSSGLTSGFDMGRNAIFNGFSGTHHAYGGVSRWGNTREFRQCDGDLAGSNGFVHWWLIPGWYH